MSMSTIVYLDDEIELTNIFQLFFEDSEHQVVVFHCEKDAIDYCNATPPDLLFVDYRLNTMKGDDVAAKVPSSISKVLVTGDIQIDSNYKFESIIQKPLKFNVLHSKTEQLLASRDCSDTK